MQSVNSNCIAFIRLSVHASSRSPQFSHVHHERIYSCGRCLGSTSPSAGGRHFIAAPQIQALQLRQMSRQRPHALVRHFLAAPQIQMLQLRQMSQRPHSLVHHLLAATQVQVLQLRQMGCQKPHALELVCHFIAFTQVTVEVLVLHLRQMSCHRLHALVRHFITATRAQVLQLRQMSQRLHPHQCTTP